MKNLYLSIFLFLSSIGCGYAQYSNPIEFLHSNSGNGYGSKLYWVDESNGNTSFRIAVRGDNPNYTDAFYIRASNNASNGFIGINNTNPQFPVHINLNNDFFCY